MLPDLKELYLRKSKLLRDLEFVDHQIMELENPESITVTRMENLKQQAIKKHRSFSIKGIIALFTF
jgi:flagellar biosynthesis/type III secretory pathway chaperone